MVIFSCVVKESKKRQEREVFFPKGKERKGKERKRKRKEIDAFVLFCFLSDVFSLFFFFLIFVSKATPRTRERARKKKKEIVRS